MSPGLDLSQGIGVGLGLRTGLDLGLGLCPDLCIDLGLVLGLESSDGKWRLSLIGDNLTDERIKVVGGTMSGKT